MLRSVFCEIRRGVRRAIAISLEEPPRVKEEKKESEEEMLARVLALSMVETIGYLLKECNK